ncbi:MAG TPA: S9 family peptidase, partial [Methylomirabilota bacterium]|nr:S9 family peptidase [Methylomirabilota bacterium]
MRRSFRWLSLAFLMCASRAAAQDKPSPEARKPLTVEAALQLRSLADLQASPDGTRVAFTVSEPPSPRGRTQHIWLFDKSTSTVRQITDSLKVENAPRWSPDGKTLAFLSSREDYTQIYLLPMNGGDATPLTKGKRGIAGFAWAPNGLEIAYLAADAKTEAEEKKEKDKNDAHVVDKEDRHSRLWLLNVATGEARPLTPADWRVSELAWAPAGDRIFVSATDKPASDKLTNRIFSVPAAANGTPRELWAPAGPFHDLRVSPDGATLSFIGTSDSAPEAHDLMLLPTGGGPPHNLTGGTFDRFIARQVWWDHNRLMTVAAEGFRQEFVRFFTQSAQRTVTMLPVNPESFVFTSGDEIVFVGRTATEPPELWLWDMKTGPRRVSHINDIWLEYALVKPEFYKYRSFDGLEVEAALLRSAGADPKAKLPLIVLVHGGPTGNWQDSIETWGQLLAARGYAVFYPNIRGSIGYGESFVEANRADWGGGDYKDIVAGVQDLIARGIADSGRVGIGGWSYGGYMAGWAITQPAPFQWKAAVSGAGMANLVSEFGTEDFPAYDEWFFGVPYERPEGFLNSSPFLHLKNARTPTLILQGSNDTVDPPGQSQELYRGLKHYGVEAELVLYPREGHGFVEQKHLVDRLNRILD